MAAKREATVPPIVDEWMAHYWPEFMCAEDLEELMRNLMRVYWAHRKRKPGSAPVTPPGRPTAAARRL